MALIVAFALYTSVVIYILATEKPRNNTICVKVSR